MHRTKMESRKKLLEVQDDPDKEAERKKWTDSVSQLTAAMSLINDYMEDVDKRTTTNVDSTKDKYLSDIINILMKMSIMISDSSEGTGSNVIAQVRNLKSNL